MKQVCSTVSVASSRRWILFGAIFLAAGYIPLLGARFDFIDDGGTVYPTPPCSFSERIDVVWSKIVANVETLGPFRPVLWVHWELQADLLQGSDLAWRSVRMLWCFLSCLLLLWLFAEFGVPPVAALAAGAIAMWNPYWSSEIWKSNTLAEGVAMPYALLGLIAARRAPRSAHPWRWDALGFLGVLAALGCKNTFIALIPAQIFLRIAPDGVSLREGIRRHWKAAVVLSLTAIMPIAHFIWFKFNWRPGNYTTTPPSWNQFGRILTSYRGGVALDVLGAGLALAVVTHYIWRCRQAELANGDAERSGCGHRLADWIGGHRAALGAGMLLWTGSVVVYLPMNAMTGRYIVPGVWGLNLIIAILLGGLTQIRLPAWTRASWAALSIGITVILIQTIGKQLEFRARNELLWETVEWIEREVPDGAQIAWISQDNLRNDLNSSEGIHAYWHMKERKRKRIRIGLYTADGTFIESTEIQPIEGTPDWAIWALAPNPWREHCDVRKRAEVPYWLGSRRFECTIGTSRSGGHTRSSADATADIAHDLRGPLNPVTEKRK
jgi:hypothetical protein